MNWRLSAGRQVPEHNAVLIHIARTVPGEYAVGQQHAVHIYREQRSCAPQLLESPRQQPAAEEFGRDPAHIAVVN